MVGAEKELTENLKHTHQQIDDQLNLLRENLQVRWKGREIGGIVVEMSNHFGFDLVYQEDGPCKREVVFLPHYLAYLTGLGDLNFRSLICSKSVRSGCRPTSGRASWRIRSPC